MDKISRTDLTRITQVFPRGSTEHEAARSLLRGRSLGEDVRGVGRSEARRRNLSWQYDVVARARTSSEFLGVNSPRMSLQKPQQVGFRIASILNIF